MTKCRIIVGPCFVMLSCLAGLSHANPTQEQIDALIARARAMQANPRFEAAIGWFEYLVSEIVDPLRKRDISAEKTVKLVERLTEWAVRLEKDPDAWAKQRGWVEWAYLSKVDGTGQPFMMWIPEDYDTSTSWPLSLNLHGGSETHIGYANKYRNEDGIANGLAVTDAIQLYVLGRGRGSGYYGLAEVDVLEVLDYVLEHWNADPDRVHIMGTSMGGAGTFLVSTRTPDLFATTRPMSPRGTHVPVENLLHVPTYTLHSVDDFRVPIWLSRATVRWLEETGGQVLQYETRGVGHGILRDKKSRIDAGERVLSQTRIKEPGRVLYTAMDELARGAYWLEIIEWGPDGRPAKVDARVGRDNTLNLYLDNINALKLNLDDSPLDMGDPLTVIINRTTVADLSGPIPPELFVIRNGAGWKVSESRPEPPSQRLHFPGGPMALYHGEPLMVVWGTQGDSEVTEQIRAIAEGAMRSLNPWWMAPNERSSMLVGRIPGKADSDVTQADMDKYNLILLGTAQQNSLVARMADRFPVKVENDRTVASDGVSWSFKDRGLGLLYYNPLAPHRLVYWAASDSPDSYTFSNPLFRTHYRRTAGPDFILMHNTEVQHVAARRFDSRWQWKTGYADSPLISAEYCSAKGYNKLLAEAMCVESGADFALVGDGFITMPVFAAVGETRWADLIAWHYDRRLTAMDLSGETILNNVTALAEIKDAREGRMPVRFLPLPTKETIEPKHVYRVVFVPSVGFAYSANTRTNPERLRLLDVTVHSALERVRKR